MHRALSFTLTSSNLAMHPTAAIAATKAQSSTTTFPLVFNTLIRTHHITSRKKLARVRKAAQAHSLPFVAVRSGGCPGIMYAESPSEAAVVGWVGAVKGLRYKDFSCVRKPGVKEMGEEQEGKGGGEGDGDVRKSSSRGWQEVTTTAEFAAVMERRGVVGWWKAAMGFGSGSANT